MEYEKRHLEIDEMRVVKADDGVASFEGYVAKFGQRSRFMGFYEEIEHRAFDNVIADKKNVFALYNHDWNQVLGSTENRTLEISKDAAGVKFRLTPKADTDYIRNVRSLVDSGELRGVSFGFKAIKDKWRREDGKDIRTLLDVEISEITLTPRPAYESSEVSLRNYEQHLHELEKHKRDEQRSKIYLLNNL